MKTALRIVSFLVTALAFAFFLPEFSFQRPSLKSSAF
jgi:hypothetical protein